MAFVRVRSFFSLILMAGLLAGCFAKPDTSGPTSADSYDGPHKTRALIVDGEAAGGSGTSSRGAGGAGDGSGMAGGPAEKPTEMIVYFDYDMSVVKPEWRDLLTRHARYLAANPDVKVVLEGHCDERGTREYNVALGERRANAVQRFLTVQGVSASQLEVVSYGEEKLRATGTTEADHSQNRRVEFRYE